MLPAFFAEFFELQFVLELFLVAGGKISAFFAHFTPELDEIFLRHDDKFKI